MIAYFEDDVEHRRCRLYQRQRLLRTSWYEMPSPRSAFSARRRKAHASWSIGALPLWHSHKSIYWKANIAMALFISCWISQSVLMLKPSSKTKHAFRCTWSTFVLAGQKLSRCVCPRFFDPLNCRPRRKTSSSFREAEIKHGRVAMLAPVDSQLQSTTSVGGGIDVRRISPFNKPLANVLALCSRVLGTIEASTLGTKPQPMADLGRWRKNMNQAIWDSIRSVCVRWIQTDLHFSKRTEQWPLMGAITLMVAQELRTGTKLFGWYHPQYSKKTNGHL